MRAYETKDFIVEVVVPSHHQGLPADLELTGLSLVADRRHQVESLKDTTGGSTVATAATAAVVTVAATVIVVAIKQHSSLLATLP